jgi:hypothetical protein
MKHSSFYGSLVAVTAWTGLSLFLGGCSVANRAIRSDFTEFNTTLQFNQTQQMLLMFHYHLQQLLYKYEQ